MALEFGDIFTGQAAGCRKNREHRAVNGDAGRGVANLAEIELSGCRSWSPAREGMPERACDSDRARARQPQDSDGAGAGRGRGRYNGIGGIGSSG